ncbi:hypothetical protein Aperf_G00000067088 [Anoplocephala perfoliata]
MGGDGGSIPRRVELVRNKKQKEKVGKVAADAAKWKHCALSQEPLRQPIVACQLGRLYNKEAIIEKLLDPTKYTSTVADHIKKLKDVKELKLTPIPKELQSHELSSGLIENSAESFCCPIMGQEMNGSYPFVFSWACGCVISKRAFDNVKDSSCLNCETDEDIQIAKDRLKAYMELSKKSRKNHASSSMKPDPDVESDKKPSRASEKRHDHSDQAHSILDRKRARTEDEEDDAKRKASAFSLTSCRSVQDDPNASSAYKSLFTTCEEARNQPKSHWVTFNPLYFR